jgi:hypothetical protein
MRALMAALLVVIPACADSSYPTDQREAIGDGDAIPLVRFTGSSLAFSVFSGIADPERRVVADAHDWAALWQRIHAGVSPMPPMPDVDFEKEMILAAALGSRPSGGYSIRIERLRGGDGVLEALVSRTTPGRDCMVIAAVTAPVDLVRVPRIDQPISWREEAEERTCS